MINPSSDRGPIDLIGYGSRVTENITDTRISALCGDVQTWARSRASFNASADLPARRAVTVSNDFDSADCLGRVLYVARGRDSRIAPCRIARARSVRPAG